MHHNEDEYLERQKLRVLGALKHLSLVLSQEEKLSDLWGRISLYSRRSSFVTFHIKPV